MAKRYDCDHELGLSREERACLSGFTWRAVAGLAHLREAWCNADAQNRQAVENGIRALLDSHSLQTYRGLARKVLAAGLDDPRPLLSAVGFTV